MNQTIAAALLLLLAGAIGGWFAGWIARGEETRKYQASRVRHLARQLAEALADRDRVLAEVARVPAPTAPVVHVHMPPTRPARVIEAEVLDELPPVVPVDLDALALDRKELAS